MCVMRHVFSKCIILFHTQTSVSVMGKDKKKKKKEETESTSDSGPDDVSTWMFDNSTYVWIFVFPDLHCLYLCYVGSAILFLALIKKTPVS